MQKLLLIFFLLFSQIVCAQRGFLYVKKKGFKKVRSFEEGSMIKFQTKDNQVIYGGLARIKKDSVYVNQNWFAVSEIKKIILRANKFHFDSKTFLLTTAGVALSTAGMTLAEWANFKDALTYSAGIGYGNFIIANFPSLKRKKYKTGKKFTLQTLDLHF
jgi:hypothetical protein